MPEHLPKQDYDKLAAQAEQASRDETDQKTTLDWRMIAAGLRALAVLHGKPGDTEGGRSEEET